MRFKISLAAMTLAATLPLSVPAADTLRPGATPAPAAAAATPARPGADVPRAPMPGTSGAARSSNAPLFQQLDRDGDGRISRDEARRSAETQSQFDVLDTDHDGTVSGAEWDAAGKR